MSDYQLPTNAYNPYQFDTSYVESFGETAKEKIQNIQLPSVERKQEEKKQEAEKKEKDETEEPVAESQMELPSGYTISTRRRNYTAITELKDADGNVVKSYSGDTRDGLEFTQLINQLETEATKYAIERDQLRKDKDKRETYRESMDDTIDNLSEQIYRMEEVSNSADLTTTEGQGAYFASQQRLMMLNEQLLTLTLLNQQLDTKVKDKETGEEKDKWSLKDIGLVLSLVASGLSLGDSITKLFEDDDISEIDVGEEMRKAIELQTDPEIADQMINSAYRDMPRLTDLENLSAFRNQFGSFAGEYFNDPNIGEELESLYQDFIIDNPDVSRDQFLMEFANANPTDPLSQKIQYDSSRMGQLARTTSQLRDINLRDTITGFNQARDFYKPLNEGGMGFRPDDFRSQEQKDITAKAMGLVNNPDMQLLKDSIGRRVRNQGRLETDELRDITNASLTSVDPSLQNQAYLRSGGLARSILNTSSAMRNRLTADESAYGRLLGEDRANVTTANNVIASNTINPAEAFGLEGTNTSLANQIYTTNPTNSLNYDPTSQYFSSMSGINANIRQANAMGDSIGTKATDVANSANSFIDNYERFRG